MIKVTDKYYVDVNSGTYTVTEKKLISGGKNKGEYIHIDASYFTDFNSAIECCRKRVISDCLSNEKLISLNEAIENIKKVNNEFSKLLKDVQNNEG